MRWKWCEMCRFDKQCENQDRNMECACYAREQTLRAEQYGNLIDIQQKKISQLKELLKECRPFVELCNYTPENKRLLKNINKLLGDKKDEKSI